MDDLGFKVSYLAAKKGIPVYSSDEVELGTVVEVLDAPEADLFDGIIFDTTANRPEQHLASGLYPGLLQFKHQVQITLKLFGYPRNCDPYRPAGRTSHINHRRISGDRGGAGLRDQLVQTGDDVAVRAAVRMAEQFEQPPLDTL